MKKSLLILFAGLCLLLIANTPAAAQGFHRIGHVAKSHTKKAAHSNKNVQHAGSHQTKKRDPDHDEHRRRKEAKRQEKRRAEGPRPQPAAKETEAIPEPVETNP